MTLPMDGLYFVSARRLISVAVLASFVFSCMAVSTHLLLPKMGDEERAILSEIRKQKVRGLVYHHASLKDNDLVIIVSYPSWSKNQVEIMGLAALENAEPIFTMPEKIVQFTLYTANGSKDPEKKHFITVTRDMWENPSVTLSSGPVMAYETAKTYYVGPEVSGRLSFLDGPDIVNLPPQKPMP